MSKYIIRSDFGDIDLSVTENQTWGGTQQAIIYESPGTNGGIVIVTGRNNNTINLNGKILPVHTQNPPSTFDPMISCNNIKNELLAIKDRGKPITLLAPVNNDDTGRYLITEFSGNVIAGISTYLPFTMTLVEFRQSNLKQSSQNLISLGPEQEFIKRLKEQNISA
jgi:hypothetical protein